MVSSSLTALKSVWKRYSHLVAVTHWIFTFRGIGGGREGKLRKDLPRQPLVTQPRTKTTLIPDLLGSQNPADCTYYICCSCLKEQRKAVKSQ